MQKTAFRKITAKKLKKLLAHNTKALLIDTLPADLHARCHIPGAKNACVYEVVFPNRVGELAPQLDQDIIVYGSSRHSRDSRTAAEKLLRLGYSRVHVMEGGLAAWQQEGFAVTGDQIHAEEDPATRLVVEDRIYRVDIERSLIEWTGRNANNKHVGSVRLSAGEISVNAGAIGGHFEIDMRSIRNYNLEGDELQPVLIAHLESDDFFFSALRPRSHPLERPLRLSPLFRAPRHAHGFRPRQHRGAHYSPLKREKSDERYPYYP